MSDVSFWSLGDDLGVGTGFRGMFSVGVLDSEAFIWSFGGGLGASISLRGMSLLGLKSDVIFCSVELSTILVV